MLGWRPVVVFKSGIDFSYVLEASRFRSPGVSNGTLINDWQNGAAITFRNLPLPAQLSVEAGVLSGQSSFRDEEAPARRPLFFLNARVGGDKVVFGVRHMPANGWQLTAGLSDLGGALYWWLR